jgi:tetratricopeptide (TPR) repeat protein
MKDLEDYLSANSIKIALFDYKPEKPPAPEVRPATPFESDLAVARLLSRAEDPRDAEELFARLEGQDAANPELAEAYGFHLMFRKKPDEAKERFNRAIQAGSRNPKVHMQYAFMVQNESAEESVKALKKAVELEPGDKELQYYLGRMLLQSKRYAEALSTLVDARPVPPEHVYGFLEAMTYIYLAYKQPIDAGKTADRALMLAKSDTDKLRASALKRVVNQWEQAAASRKDAEERYRKFQEERAKAGNDAARPAPVIAVESTLPKVTGKLQRVECMGQRATLHVLAAGKLQQFVIDDPGSVVITGTGADGSTAEFSCGPQKDLAVSVGHVDGVVRTLGFQ